MDHYQNQYGGVTRTDAYGNTVDEHGNPVEVRRDEFGDPIYQHTGPTGAHGTTASAGTPGFGSEFGTGGHHKEQHGVSGALPRSGSSSSSSSSEDDGQGGRRKKGLKEKIKEKIPGMGHKEPQATATTTPGGFRSAEEPHEKKGMMEKIKEKLPGHHTEHQ